MLPRTRAPFGMCNGVIRLLHTLTTARTACSSDTDHSFVLGIVLDSCNRSEHASASGFSTWMQRVLPHLTPCTHSKDVLLPSTSSQSSPAHQGQHLRSWEESLLCALHTPWIKPLVFHSQSPSQVLKNDEEKSGNFTQERPKTKQLNKPKKFTEKFQKYKKRGTKALRKAESSLRSSSPRPKAATCHETGACVPFVNSHSPDSAFSLLFWNCSISLKF